MTLSLNTYMGVFLIILNIVIVVFLICIIRNKLQCMNIVQKYTNKENKDNILYDINYLIEQKLYKTMSSKDKKEYLELEEDKKKAMIQNYILDKLN